MCVPISQIMTIIGKNVIRASVDALCRDETGQISRDPHKNCLKTRRERLPSPSKQTKSHSWAGIQLSTCRNALYAPPVLCARIRSRAISRILCHHHHHDDYSSSSSVNPLSPCWNELTGWFFHEGSPESVEVCTVIKRSFLSFSSCLW